MASNSQRWERLAVALVYLAWAAVWGGLIWYGETREAGWAWGFGAVIMIAPLVLLSLLTGRISDGLDEGP
jgi:hypothetical protein